MCGRFSLTQAERAIIGDRFELEDEPDLTPRYNIAPSQKVAVIMNDKPRKIQEAVWGLPFAKVQPINTRVDSLEKPFFHHLLEEKRCLVPADGFYEWRKEAKGKVPMRIVLKGRGIFAFAGIWMEKDGIRFFSILTTEPNELMKPIHHRMPVILEKKSEKAWLSGESLTEPLKPYPSDEMEAYEISTLVNSPKNDVEDVIRRVGSNHYVN
jgi:putative SOS response-associated peptidase YedK